MPLNTFDKLSSEKQQRVMDAAADEFAEHGFHQASMNRVVKRLNIAKGSLFKYFGTKEGLFEALFTRSLSQVKQSIKDAAGGEGDFFERFRDVLLAGLSFIDSNPRRYRIYLKLLFQENTPLRDKVITTVRGYTTSFLRPMVQNGVQSGQLRPDLDVDTTVFLLASTLEQFLQAARVRGLSPEFYGLDTEEAEVRADRIMNLLRKGLAADNGNDQER